MELKKLTYFPYLPNSRIEDNKRYKYIRDMMEKNPFTFHRKKNALSFFDKKRFKIIDSKSDNIEKNNEINTNSSLNNNNQESLIFQKDHDKYMNLYNNFMKKKTSTIESNAQNYLNYLINLKKPFQITNNINNDNKNYNLIKTQNNSNYNAESISNINKSTNLNNLSNTMNNNTIPISNHVPGRKNFILGIKSPTETNLFSPRGSLSSNNIFESEKEKERENFIASNIKTKNSDITNPFFYNGIAKEIIKLKQETMDYNKKESENKYKQKKNYLRYSNDDIALSPEKIHNPNYYNIGESHLEINPIINRGHYSMSYSRNHKTFNRQKSDFY